jgi:LuxR family maltose regulon positive regulatory protein
MLQRDRDVPLILVSAPAGTGKTALVAEWARSRAGKQENLHWISFEVGDADLWGPMLQVLSKAGLNLGTLARPARKGARARTTSWNRAQLVSLAAAVVGSPQPLTVVLDGFEMVSADVARDVDFLLRNTLGQLRIVLVTRVDPLLPLYRYRLDDTLAEIRLPDLSFTDDEASRLLRGLDVELPKRSVLAINQRIQGWAVGLRFVAKLLAEDPRPEESVAAIVSEVRDINEYLVGEILNAQTPAIRRFLLETSVLDELTPDDVELVAGAAGLRTLEQLATSNVLIEPLPHRPGSYRYYPFFRDLLRAQLGFEAPQRMAQLRHSLADHYRGLTMYEEALAQLFTIRAWGEAARLLVDDQVIGRLLLAGASGPLVAVLSDLPAGSGDGIVQLVRAAANVARGEMTAAANELAGARSALAGQPDDTPTAVAFAVVDALRSCFSDSADTARTAAERATRATTTANPGGSAAAELVPLAQLSMGIASLRCGDLAAARAALRSASAAEPARSAPAFRARSLGYEALVEALDGRLERARRLASQSSAAATEANLPADDRSSAATVAMAYVCLEQYELTAARAGVTAAESLPLLRTEHFCSGLLQLVRAGLDHGGGHVRSALSRIDAGAEAAAPTDPWLADALRVEGAKVSLVDNHPEVALRRLEGLYSPDAPAATAVSAAAHAELAHDDLVGAYLARPSEAMAPDLSVWRLLVQAAYESRRPSSQGAHATLEKAIRLAARQRLRRPLREGTPSVRRLLATHPRLLQQHTWVIEGSRTDQSGAADASRSVASTSSERVRFLVEPLTGKELEVLGHLDALLTTDEIAREMFVSVNTVKTHVRNILRKLNATRRNEAVRAARELRLIPAPTPSPEVDEDTVRGVRSAERVEPTREP